MKYQRKDGVRRNQVSIRCNDTEYDAIAARARAAGINSHSEYIRHLILVAPQLEEIAADLARCERRLDALEAHRP